MNPEDVAKILAAALAGGGITGIGGLWWFKRWAGVVDAKLDLAIQKWTEVSTTVAVLVDRDTTRKAETEHLDNRVRKLNDIVQQLLAQTRIPLTKTEAD